MAEHYGERIGQEVSDVGWLDLAGRNGWSALMKDERIRYRLAERAAVLKHGVRAFYLTSANLTAHAMADRFIGRRELIWDLAQRGGPGLFAVSETSVREIGLD